MNATPEDPDVGRLLDRLVDGDVHDGERRLLLHQLEHSPDGWRRCALAFLEAQTWRETLVAAVRPASEERPAARPARRRPVVRYAACAAALAACLAVAFGLGWSTRGRRTAETAPGVVRTVERPTNSPAPAPAPAGSERQTADASAPSLDDALVRRWEQRGYRVESQTRQVALRTRDGRHVEVPVREFRLHYTGGRTY